MVVHPLLVMSDRKTKNPTKTPANAAAQKPARKGKPPKAGKSPAWWSFTTKTRSFVHAAKALSDRLAADYGASATITHFERMLAELPNLSREHLDLCKPAEDLLALYDAYLVAKEERDSERETFRSFRTVAAIATGLEVARAAVAVEQKQEA